MDLFYLLTLLSLVLVVLGVFGFARVRRHASKQPERTIGASRVTLRIDGQEREFFYYIPKGGGEGRPLVVALHGGMASALAFGRRTALDRMADTYGFNLVLPQSVPAFAQRGRPARRGWGAQGNGLPQLNMDAETRFLVEILNQMAGIVAYDNTRVFLTGLSRGGMLAYHVASLMPDRIRAIAVVAGTNTSDIPGPGMDRVALLHIHGTRDENVPWKGGAGAQSWRGADWQSVQRGIDMFTRTGSANVEHRVRRLTEDTVSVLRVLDRHPIAEICLVDGGGHAWPGSEPANWQRGSDVYVSPHFNATDYIGKFFSRF